MRLSTNLPGRLRNTPLPKSHGLLPLFEAVVNSIHAISEVSDDPKYGLISIDIERMVQHNLPLEDGKIKRGAPLQDSILGFRITDNGAGFHEQNMDSFETLDSVYKAELGCRGVGRLLWLKAFEGVYVKSVFKADNGKLRERQFSFTASSGVDNLIVKDAGKDAALQTAIKLSGFNKPYREKSPKTARKIANDLFEHCLWYFVRPEGMPSIIIYDGDEIIDLDDVFEEYMFSSSNKEIINLKGNEFELTHLKLKPGTAKQNFIAWCAASRVVEEEAIAGKIPGLHGKLKDEDGEFIYACYVTSRYLDQHVRPERIGFDIEEMSDDLFSQTELNLTEIRRGVLDSASRQLSAQLVQNQISSRERLERFISQRAPRYRPVLSRMSAEKLHIDPEISDKELDLILHKQLSELESSVIAEGHEIIGLNSEESPHQYRQRLSSYLEKVDDIKKSDLANYVFHRKVVLDILAKAIERGADGKYAKEELIHELIIPLRTTSNEIHMDNCNLWLIDERLAFHDFLASDKPLSSIPITGSNDNKEPDICALNVFDEPILVADGQRMPLASIVIVEIKRPMRNDAGAGEDKDPVEQALGYLERIRSGGARTSNGRPIPQSEEIPGFCYAICDLTPSVIKRCKLLGLSITSDHMGYFGYNANYKAFIEVISFDRLLNSARERNQAFFDKLGISNA
jgi:hypothetical protein